MLKHVDGKNRRLDGKNRRLDGKNRRFKMREKCLEFTGADEVHYPMFTNHGPGNMASTVLQRISPDFQGMER